MAYGPLQVALLCAVALWIEAGALAETIPSTRTLVSDHWRCRMPGREVCTHRVATILTTETLVVITGGVHGREQG